MKRCIYLAVLLLTASCTARTDHNLNSVLWVQTAAEYPANCHQAYNSALMNIDAAIADSRWTGALEQTNDFSDLPPAVIFDLDETVLDNSAYQAQLVKEGSGFQLSSWDQWVGMRQAGSIAGAVEFINYLQNQGVEVFFITNRECRKRSGSASPCPQEKDTIENLNALGISGIKGSNVLLKNEYADWVSEKQGRRAYIAEKYRILMLFGDDLGDFIPGVQNDIAPGKRREIAETYHANWGTKWFIIPNPMYGSWYKVLKTPPSTYLQGVTAKDSEK